MGKLFGTDGVRGIPGSEPLTDPTVRRLGAAAAAAFLESRPPIDRDGEAPAIVLGRDTRRSGERLARFLAEGFADAGCRAVDVGIATTPAAAYLAKRLGALCAAVVSASHNPPEFNGIKFFTSEGFKAPAEVEDRIEELLRRPAQRSASRPSISRAVESLREYRDFLRSTFPPLLDLRGLRIVVDAANGAASQIAPGLFRSLGAEVFAIGCSPNGRNINVGCGALDTGAMQRSVRRLKAHCGVSLDGDADRAVFSDERGRLLDGDVLIAMSAVHLREKGLLRGGRVVLSVMSNFGLIRYLEERGIGAVQVPVGDRNVTDAIEAGGYCLGGESSGHIVFRRLAPTGDGLLTTLQTLAVLVESGGPMSRFRSLYRSCPQDLRNVRVLERVPLKGLAGFRKSLRCAERRLAGRGRIFVRYSGTEPLLRILVEGPDRREVRRISEGLARSFLDNISPRRR
ncbi:MAG: phosphoglucosamine mutase [Elusimicrobia bacterium]|nr:phosphoglucosamine mutase [Elusimicrobiota bacterium]